MMEKLKRLHQLSKDVRAARVKKYNAVVEICSYDNKPEVACIKSSSISTERENSVVSCECKSFKTDDTCDNTQCPIFQKNLKYVQASAEYDNALRLRREFLRGLFGRLK